MCKRRTERLFLRMCSMCTAEWFRWNFMDFLLNSSHPHPSQDGKWQGLDSTNLSLLTKTKNCYIIYQVRQLYIYIYQYPIYNQVHLFIISYVYIYIYVIYLYAYHTSNYTPFTNTNMALFIHQVTPSWYQDTFGAVCGALRGGGVLLLSAPPLEEWKRSSMGCLLQLYQRFDHTDIFDIYIYIMIYICILYIGIYIYVCV